MRRTNSAFCLSMGSWIFSFTSEDLSISSWTWTWGTVSKIRSASSCFKKCWYPDGFEVETTKGVLEVEKMEGDNGDDENENPGFDEDDDDDSEAAPSIALSSEDPEVSVVGLMAARGAWKTVWGLRSDCVNSV